MQSMWTITKMKCPHCQKEIGHKTILNEASEFLYKAYEERMEEYFKATKHARETINQMTENPHPPDCPPQKQSPQEDQQEPHSH